MWDIWTDPDFSGTCGIRHGLSGAVLSDDFRYLKGWQLLDFKFKLVREFGQVLRSRFDVMVGVEKWTERGVSARDLLPGLPRDEVQLISLPLPECFDQCRWATEDLFMHYIIAPLGKRFSINGEHCGVHCFDCGQAAVCRIGDVLHGWVRSRGGKWRCVACMLAVR